MNHYLIFGIGGFLGFLWGLLIAGLCSAAHNGDHDQELWQAYKDGITDGQLRPGCTLAGVAAPVIKMKPLTQEQIDTGRAAVKRMAGNSSKRGKG